MKPFEMMNRMLDLIIFGTTKLDMNTATQSFGIGPDAISVVGNESNIEFNRLLTDMHQLDNDIFDTYSLKSFLNDLVVVIRLKKKTSQVFNLSDYQSFIAEIKRKPIVECKVMRDINGIVLDPNLPPLQLGNFIVYCFKSHQEIIKQRTKDDLVMMCLVGEPMYLIEYDVNAREQSKALEIADDYFEKFTLFLRYIIGRSDSRYEVGILNYHGWRSRSAYIFCNSWSGQSAENYGSIAPIPINDPYFCSPALGYDKIWALLDMKSPSKLQRRISTAVEWVGKSLFEKSIQSAFIQASVAIEAIFTYSEKCIVTPSILSQISESVAQLIGTDAKHKIDLEKQVKDLYSVRSGIVHAGKKEVVKEDYEIFIFIIRTVIHKLLTDPQLSVIKTIDDLYMHLKQLKYS